MRIGRSRADETGSWYARVRMLMWRRSDALRLSGWYARAAHVAWLLGLPTCAPAPGDPRAGSPADVAPPPRPAASNPLVAPAAGGDLVTSAADAGAPGDGPCSPSPSALAGACNTLV